MRTFDFLNSVKTGDPCEILRTLPPASVKLMVADVPSDIDVEKFAYATKFIVDRDSTFALRVDNLLALEFFVAYRGWRCEMFHQDDDKKMLILDPFGTNSKISHIPEHFDRHQIVKKLIQKCTTPNDIVLDPFAGTGLTAVECIRLGRFFLCIEKDEAKAKKAVSRVLCCLDKELKLC